MADRRGPGHVALGCRVADLTSSVPDIPVTVQDRLSRAAAAAEQLSAVLWETLHAEAAAGHASTAAALSERLAELARSVGLLCTIGGEPTPADGGSEGVRAAGAPASGQGPGSAPAQARHGGSPEVRPVAPAPAAGRHGSSLEGGAAQPAYGEGWPREQAGIAERARPDVGSRPGGHEPASLIDERRPSDMRPSDMRSSEPRSSELSSSELSSSDMSPIEVRDVRQAEVRDVAQAEVRDVGQAEVSPWRAAVQRRLQRFAQDGTPFSVMVLEVLDAVRLQLAQPPQEAQQLAYEIEAAIAGALRPADSLTREAAGRYWLIAPDTGAVLARSLAEQLAAAVGGALSHRGAPIRLTVGIAICPDHGQEPDALLGHADMDLYAAQAAGRSVGGFEGGAPPR